MASVFLRPKGCRSWPVGTWKRCSYLTPAVSCRGIFSIALKQRQAKHFQVYGFGMIGRMRREGNLAPWRTIWVAATGLVSVAMPLPVLGFASMRGKLLLETS